MARPDILSVIRSAMPKASRDTPWTTNRDIGGRNDACRACEEAFGITLSSSAIDTPPTVGDFIDIVAANIDVK
jgi:hypothetical protein